VTVEVDPDQAAGNAALVAGIGARVGNSNCPLYSAPKKFSG
jgi:hypothetical protein